MYGSPSYMQTSYGVEFELGRSVDWLGDDASILPMAEWQIEQAEEGRWVNSFQEAVNDPKRAPNLSHGGWFHPPTSNEGAYARGAFALAVGARILQDKTLIEPAKEMAYSASWRGLVPGTYNDDIQQIALQAQNLLTAAGAKAGNTKAVQGMILTLSELSKADAIEAMQQVRDETSTIGISKGAFEGSAEDAGQFIVGAKKTALQLWSAVTGNPLPGQKPPPKWKVWLMRGSIAFAAGGVILYLGRPYIELAQAAFDKDEDD